MDEKDKNPITINELLEQMTKTPATPSQGVHSLRPNPPTQPTPPQPTTLPKPAQSATSFQSRPTPNQDIRPLPPVQSKPTTPPPLQKSQPPSPQTRIKLPSLDKIVPKPTPSQSEVATESRLKLSIRTMASDLDKLRKGQKPLGEEVGKEVVRPQPHLPPLPTAPATPIQPVKTQPETRPPLTEEQHHHTERIITKEELPAFLGGTRPSKTYKPKEEKVEYGLIAKVIGSGLTTGVVITVVLALITYFMISYLFFNEEGVIVTTPTPITTTPPPNTGLNEINSIFSGVTTTSFAISDQIENTIPNLKVFIENQVLETKELKRLNITSQSGETLLFKEMLSLLTKSLPQELEDFIEENHMTLIYRQEELLSEDSLSNKRLVFIVNISDPDAVSKILKEWEPTMPNDFKNIFDLDLTQATSPNFLDNDRRGIKIRYKNFPLPDRSIDYSIVSSLTGRYYLIITNSRESMYSPTDKIRGLGL
ncbi:MAG: hypothetical protein A2816_00375 [Candidatus Yanofskybacteria bacterium RIFCSPHIGHO2_01_FULL_39_44]|nr:MAG: hypothetical protein A2816_00375 [Candidatus Yanofskybacteria bacterium RIFCSPHIGHO2_01_FULL_39_44]